jgi:hypothetical protein
MKWPMGVPRDEAEQVFQKLLEKQEGIAQLIFTNMV